MNQIHTESEVSATKLVGLLAEFEQPEELVSASDQARRAGYTATDAYSPFPVHGIDPALGITRTKLPFLVLAIALGAVVVGLGMQYYTNKVEDSPLFPGYAFLISGKPLFSLPANIPVTFEVIVLSSAFATFLGMWIFNGLPRLANPLHRVDRFKRVTNDRFFLMIESRDQQFNRERTQAQLQEWGATAVEEVKQDLTDGQLPGWFKWAGVLLGVLLLVPPVAIYRAAGLTSREPRLHFNPDMDWQIKYKAQTVAPVIGKTDTKENIYLFSDGRSNRRPVAGSIRWGGLKDDRELHEGIRADYDGAGEDEDLSKYVTEFPQGLTVDVDFIKRGQERFNIYCSACHGYAGQGDGLVNQRAVALNVNGDASWTAAKSLHDVEVVDEQKNPLGRIYETITDGRNTMGPYRAQISLRDRWAIVAYVKALQQLELAQSMVEVPAEGDEVSSAEDATAESEDSADESDQQN